MNPSTLVEPDRVHRSVYTDQEIFDQEIKNIWEKTWVYCGHESQIPQSGDYHTLHIGKQPMVMIRGHEGEINVLYNRCPHRGVQVCGAIKGNSAGGRFISTARFRRSRSSRPTTVRACLLMIPTAA